MNFKKIFRNPRIIILIVFLLLSLIAINPDPTPGGVAIRSIDIDSAASNAIPPIEIDKKASPRSKLQIIAVNGQEVDSVEAFYNIEATLQPEQTITIETSKGVHRVTVEPTIFRNTTNETEFVNITKEVFNNDTNTTENITELVEQPVVIEEIIGKEPLGFNLYAAPENNIRKGLDLSGGTRVLLRPEKKLTESEIEFTIENIKERLNVFGLSDIIVRKSTDIVGNDYILVEIAGATEEDISELIGNQGKFEAKINDEVIFSGGKEDIINVCFKDPSCEGLDVNQPCGQDGTGGWACRFTFSITISPDSAERQAEATRTLDIITENGQDYLSSDLELYLDDTLVDSLRIGSVFRGTPITDISISGPGVGSSERAAIDDALKEMRSLQSIMKTGSLPSKLIIEKVDTISPLLGEEFENNAIIIAGLTILAVGIVVFIRYRRVSVSVPLMITMLSEVVIILGFAALIKWNLDLAAIAGIIIAIGTGVDHQIVITDETLRGEMAAGMNWKDKLKRAFIIIMVAYATTVVAMIPLMFAGAGLLKGFAFTTILGVSIGVFVTRPAFAVMVERLTQK